MKTKRLILLVLCAVFSSTIFAQKKDVPVAVSSISSEEIQPFSQGTWRYDLKQVLGGEFGSEKVNGEKSENYINGNLDIEADYFVIDNLAVGARIYRDCYRSKDVGDDISRDAETQFFVNVAYGQQFNNFNLMGKVSAGIGKYNYKYKAGGGSEYTSEYSENLFDLKASVISPIKVDNNFFLSPEIGYQFSSSKEGDWKYTESGVFLGLNLDLFFRCDDYFCDIGNDFSRPANRYRQSTTVIGSRTNFYLNTGTAKDTYPGEMGEEMEDKYGFTNSGLTANGYYYVIDNVAVGLGLGFNISNEKQKDYDYNYNSWYFDIMPKAMVNLPVDDKALRNLFLDAGIGFGTQQRKIEDMAEEATTNYSRLSYTVGIGYNYFITGKSCITPYINYNGLSRKDKTNDVKRAWSGLGLGIAWNVHLPAQQVR